MTSHIGMMMVFAVAVAAVFGALLRDDPREQLRLGMRIFGALVIGAYTVGWTLFGLFG